MSPSKRSSSLRLAVLGAALSLSLGALSPAWAGQEEDARAQNALRVLTDIQAVPESAIPDKLLDEARAIVVVPDSLKVGFVLGGRSGHGLLSVKRPDGTWSNPVFVKLTGGSIGFQVGVQSADIVLVFRNDRSLESIVNGKVTLGADAGVAAGPVGRNAQAATDGQLKAEIWSWSRARGLFAGVALDGAVLSMDDGSNESVYGRDVTPRMIFEGRETQRPPDRVVDFRDRLEEATASARATRGTDRPGEASASARTSVTTSANAPIDAPVNASAAATGTVTTAPLSTQPVAPPADPKPQPFESVNDNPAKTEPLPNTP